MNAYHDGNGVHTLITVETDGMTLVNIQCDPIMHTLHVSDGTTGSDNGPTIGFHDANHVPMFIATSRNDGKTPVVVYGTSGGALLTDST